MGDMGSEVGSEVGEYSEKDRIQVGSTSIGDT